MKKSILLIFIALITAIGCQAQEAAKRDSTAISKYQARHTLQGLKAFFETGYLWGLGGEAYLESPTGEMMLLDKNIFSPSHFSASASVGCQFNNFVFVGLGVAANVYSSRGTTYLTVPIFGELRINLLNAKRFTPFADGKLGYGIGDMHGVYCACQLGLRYALPKKRAVYLAGEWNFQINQDLKVLKADDINCNLGFKFGFEL